MLYLGLQRVDCVELEALSEVLGAGRPAPLPVFSVTGVTGISEAGTPLVAVVAGALALQAGLIPPVRGAGSDHLVAPLVEGLLQVSASTLYLLPSLHQSPEPALLGDLQVSPQPRAVEKGRAVAVSFMGFTGAVGHVVLRAPPPRPALPARADCPRLVIAQGRSELQVEEVARRIASAPFNPSYIRLTQDMFYANKYLSYDCRAFTILPGGPSTFSPQIKVGGWVSCRGFRRGTQKAIKMTQSKGSSISHEQFFPTC